MTPKFKNGQKVKDTVTGFEGTVTCVAMYMNGCIRYSIQPGLDGAGNYQESQVIDEGQLKLIKKSKEKEKKESPGGDRPSLPKFKL